MLITLTFLLAGNVYSQDKESQLAQYKAEVLKQAASYPVKINDRNMLRNGYIKGNTHVLEIQVIDRVGTEISEEERAKIDKQLNDTLGSLYCKTGTNESISRTLGLNIEYKYYDKALTPFHSVLFSQENCDNSLAKPANQRTEQEVRVAMQIRELEQVGKGTVTVCREKIYNGSINLLYTNEIEKRAVIFATDEYVVNTISISLNKTQIAEFSALITDAEAKAMKVPNLENVNLGDYLTRTGTVKLFGQKGKLKGFFAAVPGVDNVILSIDAKKISHCLSQIEPFL